jgi:signal transduction histidine kinase/tetratricopeptide (TPR) repeat protein
MRKFLLILCCYTSSAVFCQQQELIDSLLQQIPLAKNDTAAARLYKAVADKYIVSNPVKARAYANEGLALATRMKWSKAIAVFNSIIATIFNDAGNYDSALFYNNKALAVHKKNKDTFNTASVLNNMGVISQRLSEYDAAAGYFFESLKAGEALKNKHLTALAYSNIASVYFAQKDFKKALDYNFKALQIQEQEDSPDDIAAVQSAIANIYQETSDSAKAAVYYRQALQNYQKTENQFGIAAVYTNMATLYGKDYVNKLNTALKADTIWEAVSPSYMLAIVNTGNIGVAYLDMAKDSTGTIFSGENIPAGKNNLLKKAVFYLNKAIAISKAAGDVNNEAFFMGNLAEAQALNGDYKNAYINFRRYQLVQDSVFSQENKNKIAGTESKYEIAKKNEELAVKQLTINNQKNRMWLLAAGIGFLLILGTVLYRQSRIRKKTNIALQQLNYELDAANKVKATFFGILSHDLRSPVANLINFLQLQKRNPGLLSETQIADRENKISQSAEHLLETMEGILLWSKGQMENFKADISPVPVNTLFNYIDKFFYDKGNIQFNFSRADGLVLQTDLNYLQTIMRNLTANAVKALQQTGNAVITWQAAAENDIIILSITDNGPGISNEKASTLFEDTRLSGSSNGLGLHIIKDLAKAINCNIAVQSGNNGTCFTLSFQQ